MVHSLLLENLELLRRQGLRQVARFSSNTLEPTLFVCEIVEQVRHLITVDDSLGVSK